MENELGTAGQDRMVNPWTVIWTKPQRALDFVFRYQREEFLHRLYISFGFFFMLLVRLPDWLTARPDPVGVMIQLFLVGPVIGITLGYTQATMLGVAYNLTGQTVDKKLIRPLIAWTNLPFILAIVVFLTAYVILNTTLPITAKSVIWLFKEPEGMMAIGIGGLAVLYAVWIRVRGISLLFTVGTGKAILMWFASFVMTYLPFAAIVFMFFSVFYATVIGPGR